MPTVVQREACPASGWQWRHERDQRQQRHDQQVLEQQDRDDLLPARQRDVTAFAEQLHHDRGRGHDEAGARHERDRPRPSEHAPRAGEQGRAGHDLQRAEPEDLAAQAPQVRRAHLHSDHEQEHHHAELGHVQDRLRIGEPAEPERADQQAGSEIAEYRAEPDAAEQRHHHYRRAEQGDYLDEFARCGAC